ELAIGEIVQRDVNCVRLTRGDSGQSGQIVRGRVELPLDRGCSRCDFGQTVAQRRRIRQSRSRLNLRTGAQRVASADSGRGRGSDVDIDDRTSDQSSARLNPYVRVAANVSDVWIEHVHR